MLKVHFIHGLEGSPQGNKARLFAAHFDAITPAMDTSDFDSCVALHAEQLATRPPDIVVGSSFGGAVLLALLQAGKWYGPSLFLAQAGVRRGLPTTLPLSVPIWLVHGLYDDVVDIEDSRALAAANARDEVRLIEVDDDHALHASTQNGDLLNWVNELAAARGRSHAN